LTDFALRRVNLVICIGFVAPYLTLHSTASHTWEFCRLSVRRAERTLDFVEPIGDEVGIQAVNR
jgi:hypothetical protein